MRGLTGQSLAEGHCHPDSTLTMNMAFGQSAIVTQHTWGGAPGYDDNGRWPEKALHLAEVSILKTWHHLGRAVAVFLILAMSIFEVMAQDRPSAPSGDAYLAEVLATMERRANVSAKLRHQSRLAEETLKGFGNYWQLGAGPQRMTRWEMQTQVADKPANYLQVYDGRYLWTDRNMPSGRQVHRLDVGNLKARLRSGGVAPLVESPWEDMLRGAEFRGGLSQMLAELLRRFRFDAPRATQLNGLTVEALIGRWRPEQFAELCPIFGDDQTWPEQLPHHVLVLVGQSNLFPYVIEYRRADDAILAENLAGLKPTSDPLLRYEIFEARFADAIDATVFQFKPGDVDWSDETSLVFDRIMKQHGAAEAELAKRNEGERK